MGGRLLERGLPHLSWSMIMMTFKMKIACIIDDNRYDDVDDNHDDDDHHLCHGV